MDAFLNSTTFAVAGASVDRAKYGNKVFRALLAKGRQTYAINPNADFVEEHVAYPTIAELPVVPAALSLVTPPDVTRRVVADAVEAGVRSIWMQPGAQDDVASQIARDAGLRVIDDGSCILVLLATKG